MMKNLLKKTIFFPILFIAIFLVTFETYGGGTDYTWTGGTTDWSTASNWSPSGPPTSNDNIL